MLVFSCRPVGLIVFVFVAYYMCDKTAISNVFSGMVYSPFYPYSYKSNSQANLCFLTVTVPSNHFIEITVDKLNMFGSHKCALDYLHVQEYLEVTDKENRYVKERRWKPLKTFCGKYSERTKLVAKTNIISFRFQSMDYTISKIKHDDQDFNFKIFFQGTIILAGRVR
jgi:hypothetical protein